MKKAKEYMEQAVALNAAAGEDFLAGTDYVLDDTGVAVRIPYAPYTA